MRAGRLVNMLLILQRRGRVTATAVGSELGVSTRTVLRDVQALHEAGIPIYTSQGSGGGIELVGGFRTVLTGFTSDDASALLLLGQPVVARQLGMAEAAVSARRKVLQSLTPQLRRDAEELDSWLLTDPDRSTAIEPTMLQRLAEATKRCRQAALTFAAEPVRVSPLGLVSTAGAWYLVEQRPSGTSARPLDGLTSVRIVNSDVVRPAGFDLAGCWTELVRAGKVEPVVSGRTVSGRT